MPDVSARPDNLSTTQKLESELASGCKSIVDGGADFFLGFGHEAAKPVMGIKQAVTGQPSNADSPSSVASGASKLSAVERVERDTHYSAEMILAGDYRHQLASTPAPVAQVKATEPEKAKREDSGSYKVGAMAGQAFDFLAATWLCRKIPKVGESGLPGVLAAGALSALSPTENGGRDWSERGKKALMAVLAVGTYELTNKKLKTAGLTSGFLAGTAREMVSNALAGSEAAQLESKFEKGHWASAGETMQGAAGWVIAGTALHTLGAGLGKFFPKGGTAEGSISISRTEPVTGNSGSRTAAADAVAGKPALEPGQPASGAAPTSQPTREFQIVSGVMKLKSFIHRDVEGSMLKVREIIKQADGTETVGPKQKLFVQRLGGNEGTLMAKAQKADLVASCHPENLSAEDQAKHVFGNQHGKVWMVIGTGNRLILSAGDHPVVEWRKQGYVAPFRLDGGNTTINAMAPLAVGDPENMDSPESQKAWADFDAKLKEAKKLGLHAISTDVWWGLIEKNKDDFNWDYYKRVSDHIIAAGLKWVPILSFHQCGGNVGDTFNVSLPEWVWKDIAQKANLDPEALKFKSEEGHTSKEFISFWADHLAKEHYERVMQNFQKEFAAKAGNIGEVNISMGPAGELRYPSYNAHDPDAGYPSRGRLQAYSDLAIKSFRDWALKKYDGIDGLRAAWSLPSLTEEQILPPGDAQGFFDRDDHLKLQYGKDFFDWYSDSLIEHGKNMLTSAHNVFGQKGSSFYGIDIGVKIPGVHWRLGHYENGQVVFEKRLAELAAGLIRTSLGDWTKVGHGYTPILSMVKAIQPDRPGQGNTIVPSFTCLELPDGQDADRHPESLPHTLATWVGEEAENLGLWLKGENALSGALYNNFDWDLMDNLLDLPNQFNGTYHGLTFLRLGDIVDNPVARAKVTQIMQAIREDELHPQRLIDKLNRMFASVKKAA